MTATSPRLVSSRLVSLCLVLLRLASPSPCVCVCVCTLVFSHLNSDYPRLLRRYSRRPSRVNRILTSRGFRPRPCRGRVMRSAIDFSRLRHSRVNAQSEREGIFLPFLFFFFNYNKYSRMIVSPDRSVLRSHDHAQVSILTRASFNAALREARARNTWSTV